MFFDQISKRNSMFKHRSTVDRDVVVDQRKSVTAHSSANENCAIAAKKTNTNAADSTKQYTSRYNVVNEGPNKELYKGANENLLL